MPILDIGKKIDIDSKRLASYFITTIKYFFFVFFLFRLWGTVTCDSQLRISIHATTKIQLNMSKKIFQGKIESGLVIAQNLPPCR